MSVQRGPTGQRQPGTGRWRLSTGRSAAEIHGTPEEKENELWEFISAENCVDTIIKIEPAAEPFKQWFVDLRLAVIELMTELVPVPETEPEIGGISEETEPEIGGISEEIEPAAQELQVDQNGSNISEPDLTVAGVDSDDPTSAGKSDSDTPIDP